MSAYLDASVLLPILVEEPSSGAVDAYMVNSQRDLLVGDFAAAEVASALSRLVRMNLLDGDDATQRLADFDAWRVMASTAADIHAADMRLASVYVRRFDLMLRAPDALHIAVARRLGATLVTLDRRLAAAARDLGVAVDELGTP